jgi:hypothetical protein
MGHRRVFARALPLAASGCLIDLRLNFDVLPEFAFGHASMAVGASTRRTIESMFRTALVVISPDKRDYRNVA